MCQSRGGVDKVGPAGLVACQPLSCVSPVSVLCQSCVGPRGWPCVLSAGRHTDWCQADHGRSAGLVPAESTTWLQQGHLWAPGEARDQTGVVQSGVVWWPETRLSRAAGRLCSRPVPLV